jgi:regulator of RNase E activity RraA
MPTGFQVPKRKRSVSAALAAQFSAIPVANISDSMQRRSGSGPSLRPMHRDGGPCGPAVTVRTRPSDNLMIHIALNLAVEGNVIVGDGGGDLTNALIGERMMAHCIAKKFAGIVINGAIRDSGWIRAQDLAVFAASGSHRGPYKDGPGEINVPGSLGGMVVEPGDLIVGDDDGLVSVPSCRPKPSVSWPRRSTRERRAPSPTSARQTMTPRATAGNRSR